MVFTPSRSSAWNIFTLKRKRFCLISTLLTKLLTPNYVGLFFHSNMSWGSYNSIWMLSAWNYHQILQVKDSVPQDFSLLQMPVTHSGPPGYPHFSLTWLHIQGSHDPTSGLIMCSNSSQNSGKYLPVIR